ncbi:hypothetical protein MYX76_16650 [Desulfobacterota bacterium AH_259_B03_O07]|nr:hypothetical protein [Desulfobacterota bacterium AH_259_B03_O07]
MKRLQKDNWTDGSNFEEMYNAVAESFAEGKNISWYKIRENYLPHIALGTGENE